MGGVDHLAAILERKRREVARRRAHRARGPASAPAVEARAAYAASSLRRAGAPMPTVIAEIKHRSPSAGELRPRAAGGVAWLADHYVKGGAAAVSVLCDRVGFGGTVLDVRRVRLAVDVPVLFKEFVLDEVQVELARLVGAHMVLLLVRALSEADLRRLVDVVMAAGMAPVVEAADDHELDIALRTKATIVGINARDLRSFTLDESRARALVERIPTDRIAVHMSGIRNRDDLLRVADSRADAVLVGEGLMRADDPAERLRGWLQPRGAT